MSIITNEPTVVSLFVGCGGLDFGFKEEGFNLIYSCDNEPAAIRVYKANIDERAYIRDVTSEKFHDEIKSLGNCDVVIGGFPCQGFSKAGPKKTDDKRNLLYLEMRKAVDVLQPEIFIAENVDGISQNFKGKFLEYIVNDFSKIGYNVEHKIIDAANYGVPQHRRRVFFVGQKRGGKKINFPWPIQTHFFENRNGERSLNEEPNLWNQNEFSNRQPALTIRDAISDLLEIKNQQSDHRVSKKLKSDYNLIIRNIGKGQKLCNVRFSDTSVYTWEIPEVFGEVDKDDILILNIIGKNRRHRKYGDIPNGNPLPIDIIEELSGLTNIKSKLISLVEKGYLKEKLDGYDLKGAMFCSGLFKRPLWKKPSPTVLTNFYNPRYFIHPLENRTFSLRECARLQGFPDSFMFTDCEDEKQLIDGYRLVGNAVPPTLSLIIAKSVKTTLMERKLNKNEAAGSESIS